MVSPSGVPESSASRGVFLSFRPSVALISSTCSFVGNLLESMLFDPDATSRIKMTVHELLENTLKYSTDGEARLDISVFPASGGAQRVEVRASNRTSPEKAAELRERIATLGRTADLMALYVGMMRDRAHQSGSGLGLARVCVEGEMRLECAVNGDEVTISASSPAQ